MQNLFPSYDPLTNPEIIKSIQIEPNITRLLEKRKIATQKRFDNQLERKDDKVNILETVYDNCSVENRKLDNKTAPRALRKPNLIQPVDFMPMHKES